MAFPPLESYIISVMLFVVGVIIVYPLSKVLRLRPKPLTIERPRRQAMIAILIFVAIFVITLAWYTFYYGVFVFAFQLDKRPFLMYYSIDVLWVALFYTALMLPLIVVMKITKLSLRSIGISAESKGRLLALGLGFSAILLALMGLLAPSFGGGFKGFSLSLAYSLVVNIIIGFSEETLFRGYLQTRLVAYSGILKGLLTASLLFALFHFPLFYVVSGDVFVGVAFALLRFPGGLLLGYIMLTSQNIIPSSIIHLFTNWGGTVFQIWF